MESDDKHWYAVYCKSRHERVVGERLARKGFATYVADFLARTRWGTRVREIPKNLLPGYVMVRAAMDDRKYLEILRTESVVKLVGNPWPRLSWIEDEQIESLRLLLRSREHIEETAYWRSGERVEVVGGPLAGLRGLFAGTANRRHHVIVSIDLLQRSVSVEVDTKYVRRETPFQSLN